MPVLQFKGKTAVENYHYTVPHHALEFDAKVSVLPRGESPSLEGNLIIEGDNLLALKALLPTHAGRVKCIYIDPPYNTGNEGWVYNDNLTQPQFKEWIGQTVGKEGEDACRHDKWCCMMYPRLQLLKELLREDDGAIFISIDDNEVQNLRAVMDEVFGGNNFVATVIWEKVYSPKSSASFLSENHDYVVIYAKKKTQWKRRLLPRTEEQNARYSNPDNDSRGVWKTSDLSARNYYSKGRYAIECPGGRKISGPPDGRYWSVSEETLWDLDEDNRIWWGEDGNNDPALKRFLSDVKDLVPETIWTYREVGHTQDAKKEVIKILGGSETPLTPKPVELIRRICWIGSEPGDIILDSFAGTGTTGHAVLAMNAAEKETRQFILIQQPFDTKEHEKEKLNICRKITAERVQRVIGGFDYVKRGAKGKRTKAKEKGLGGSFTYARLGPRLFGEYKVWEKEMPAPEELAKYIYYTETSHEFQPKEWHKKTGRIGERKGTAYYLLYDPKDRDGCALDTAWLATIGQAENCKRLVVYCDKVWLHREDREKWEDKTGKSLRAMQLPMALK